MIRTYLNVGYRRIGLGLRAPGTPWERRRSRRPVALARYLFWSFVAWYCCELCYDCGRRVNSVWWADQQLWQLLTGWGEGGLLCQRCFSRRASDLGILLQWRPEPCA